MGERKVLNKYYPPSFDPKKIPRLRRPKNHQKNIRFMLPMHVRCNTCGNYISRGTKFNSRHEEVVGETYLGIKLHRFYIKCTNCLAELTIRTDPENTGYIAESGATCPYINGKEDEMKHEEREDALKSLENRTIVSKKEIEVMAALDEMKSMKSRRASISVDSMLEALSTREKEKEEQENDKEELLIKSIKFGKQMRIDQDKNQEAVFIEKKAKRRNCAKSSVQISSRRVISNSTAKLPIVIESLCHSYGTDSDDE